MNIELRPGEQATISRSRDGKILIVQRDSGAQLVETNDDRLMLTVEHCDKSIWRSPLEQNVVFVDPYSYYFKKGKDHCP